MSNRFVFIFLTFSLIIALILACEEEKGILQPPEIFEIQAINIPEAISSTSDRAVFITAMVTHPDGHQGIDSVFAIFSDTLILELFDDGDSQNKGSGDVIAFDQIYTTLIVGNQLGFPDGSYHVLIQALDKKKAVKKVNKRAKKKPIKDLNNMFLAMTDLIKYIKITKNIQLNEAERNLCDQIVKALNLEIEVCELKIMRSNNEQEKQPLYKPKQFLYSSSILQVLYLIQLAQVILLASSII